MVKKFGINTPIYTSSSYHFPNDTGQIIYPGNFNIENQKVVAQKMADLEHAEAGLVFASGMAAISTVLMTLCCSGDHILIQDMVFGGTNHLVHKEFKRFGIEADLFSVHNIDEIEKAIQDNTKVIYIETPSNPLLDIVDIEKVAQIAKKHGICTVIDSTFATPINQRPVDLGIDVVVHSGTKYLGGHHDLCCGVVVSTNDLIAKIREMALSFGGCLDARPCYELERSLKTLAVRVKEHNSIALKLAQFLQKHSHVQKVYFPGLPEHPGHGVAKKQMMGFGGMLSFEVVEDISPQTVFSKLKLITPAMSLGGVDSVICLPAQTSHAKMTREQRLALGMSDSLIRLSVGIEDCELLIEDLEQALV